MYSPTHGPYSAEQRQPATSYTSRKDSRRITSVATNCTFPTSATENSILSPAYLSKICNNFDNRCPKCEVAQHDVNMTCG